MVDREVSQPRKRLRTEQADEPALDESVEQFGAASEAVGAEAEPAAAAAPDTLEAGTGGPSGTAPGGCVVPSLGIGMGMPCNGCSCGAVSTNPSMLGIMQQQQQQYMMQQMQQMGMFNHMMMMGAMMGPMMGQMMGPAPTDGTALLPVTSPSTVADPALAASKVNEDDDDPWPVSCVCSFTRSSLSLRSRESLSCC